MKPDEISCHQIFDHMPDAVMFFDLNRNVAYCNQAAVKISGYPENEIHGKTCHELFVCRDFNERVAYSGECVFDSVFRDGKPVSGDVFLMQKNGTKLPVFSRTSPLMNASGAIIGALRIFYDNSPRYEMEKHVEQLETIAYLDPLTGLANRRFTEASLSARLAEMRRYKWPFGILLLDIDHFKSINDTYGHEAGDKALKFVSHLLLSVVRTSDVIGRWGGEEFLAVFANAGSQSLSAIAEKFRRILESSVFAYDHAELKMTVSSGGTVAKESDTIESIVRRADLNLYQSKQNGRNRSTLD
ncbi:MAG: sensor domain-containing diguanylate cyclase [Candidatus Aureabacteria bacterium]|nr:sensor domain-containing diguanylate cyclase [Candidatus Auribacterota bacterium]